ncbi:MAG: hypothetical protein LKJ69_08060 [Lactobacillus sp.]|jgi:hypothetical protein|nr:hypothetical protein [Lactobacillus sp.]MCI2033345.1 hypothetical protein [Lactobacillus sp.]
MVEKFTLTAAQEAALYHHRRADLIASAAAFQSAPDTTRLGAAFDHWTKQAITFTDFAAIYRAVSGELPPQDYDSTPEQGFFDDYLGSSRTATEKAVATLMALSKNNGMYRRNTAAALVAANALLVAANAGLLVIPPAEAEQYTDTIRQHYVRDHMQITQDIRTRFVIGE